MMSATSTDSLARAIDYLGAVVVAPGRVAWKEDDADNFYTVAPLSAMQFDNSDEPMVDPDKLTTMPSWWSPEQRFALDEGPMVHVYATAEKARANAPESRVITADLETGAEIPARTTCEGVGF